MKIKLDSIQDHIVKEIWIRSKCDWHEHGKKHRGTQSTIPKPISGHEEFVDETEISKELKTFYQKFYEKYH